MDGEVVSPATAVHGGKRRRLADDSDVGAAWSLLTGGQRGVGPVHAVSMITAAPTASWGVEVPAGTRGAILEFDNVRGVLVDWGHPAHVEAWLGHADLGRIAAVPDHDTRTVASVRQVLDKNVQSATSSRQEDGATVASILTDCRQAGDSDATEEGVALAIDILAHEGFCVALGHAGVFARV